MATYVVADLHLDHNRVLEMSNRPFATIEEMREVFFDNINLTVQQNDTLIVNGDFSFKSPEPWLKRIRCKNVVLVIGNHDPESGYKYFKLAKLACQIKIPDPCWVSHYCHAYWPKSHYGSYHVYGHHHGQREKTLDLIWPERRAMDVGIDIAFKLFGQYRPFKTSEIFDILSVRKGHDPVSFYRSSN